MTTREEARKETKRNESTKRPLIDHQDPQRIKCFNERIAGENLKQGGLRMGPVKTPTPSRSLPRREQWKVRESRRILAKPWLTVRQDTVELPNGNVIPEYFVFEYPDWVNVIPVTEDGRIVLVRQYRHGIGRVCWEIPAGVVEKTDPTPLAGAQRELLEETGFSGGVWEELMQASGNPAAFNNITYCYVARGVRATDVPHLDAGEDLSWSLHTPDEVRALLERGAFVQSLMAAPLWKFFSRISLSNERKGECE